MDISYEKFVRKKPSKEATESNQTSSSIKEEENVGEILSSQKKILRHFFHKNKQTNFNNHEISSVGRLFVSMQRAHFGDFVRIRRLLLSYSSDMFQSTCFRLLRL